MELKVLNLKISIYKCYIGTDKIEVQIALIQ